MIQPTQVLYDFWNLYRASSPTPSLFCHPFERYVLQTGWQCSLRFWDEGNSNTESFWNIPVELRPLRKQNGYSTGTKYPFSFWEGRFFFQGRTVSFEELSYLNRPGNFAGDVVWDGVLLLPNGFFTRVNHFLCVNNWCHLVSRKKAKLLKNYLPLKSSGAYKNNVFSKGIDVSPPPKKNKWPKSCSKGRSQRGAWWKKRQKSPAEFLELWRLMVNCSKQSFSNKGAFSYLFN